MKRVKIREAAERVKRDIRQFWAVGVAFAIYSVIVRSVFGAFCPFLIVTGFPCAGCGLTRAGMYLLRGNFSQAAALNPSIFAFALFLLYCGYFRYLEGTKVKGFSLAQTASVALSRIRCGYFQAGKFSNISAPTIKYSLSPAKRFANSSHV